jgi:cysteine synthase A
MRLSANVVDCAYGVVAPNAELQLRQQHDEQWRSVTHGWTDADAGRTEWDFPQIQSGTYQLEIDISAYYAALGVLPLHPRVIVEFCVLDSTVDLNLTVLVTANSFHIYRINGGSVEPTRGYTSLHVDSRRIALETAKVDVAGILDEISRRPPTPILPICACVRGRDVTVRLKLESANKWGSIKDRTALGLIKSVASELDDPDATLVESTSGNLGVALAAIARELGRRFIAVVDPNLSQELAAKMTRNGAQLDFVSDSDRQGSYLGARLARVAELVKSVPGAVWTDQYHNPANPLAHYRSTAPEMLYQAPGTDAVFVAVSTGGTLAGISRYMREHVPDAAVIAVDVPGSRVFGEPKGRRILTGIGAGRSSSFLSPDTWDDVVLVEDPAAIAVCHQVRDAVGVSLGGSSGAAIAACLQYLETHPQIVAPLCVCPDGGAPYEHTIYADDWLRARSVELAPWRMPVIFR